MVSQVKLDDTFTAVRSELRELGLIRPGAYLDEIVCKRSPIPSVWGLQGWVYDQGVEWYMDLVGQSEGTIHVPWNVPYEVGTHGQTLRDIIRHEFGHAWAWVDREFLEQAWFERAFGAGYFEDFVEKPEFDPDEFVSEYACTSPAEDFCETFATYVRYRKSLHRFDDRPRIRRKLRAVEKAVARARKRVG